jgi:hypothetical protein
MNFYGLEVNPISDITWNFIPANLSHAVGIFLVAERGPDSTTHINPTQDQYRSTQEWTQYRANLKAIQNSSRPYFELCRPPDGEMHSAPASGIPCYRYLGRLSRDIGIHVTAPASSHVSPSVPNFFVQLLSHVKRAVRGLIYGQ